MAADTTVAFDTKAVINWRSFRSKEPGYWVAICDSLKLTAQAKTWAELVATCDEIVQELMRDLHQDGDLLPFLTSRGWRPLGRIPARSKGVRFDIPVHVAPEGDVSGRHRAPER